jgi:heme/copper-type cytochrome/quinol oxidase subunit 1
MIMRWQLAYPGRPLPLIGKLFGGQMPGGVMTPGFYNALGAMHGTIMVLLGSFFLPMGAAASGWTFYAPPADIEQRSNHMLFTGQSRSDCGLRNCRWAHRSQELRQPT